MHEILEQLRSKVEEGITLRDAVGGDLLSRSRVRAERSTSIIVTYQLLEQESSVCSGPESGGRLATRRFEVFAAREGLDEAVGE